MLTSLFNIWLGILLLYYFANHVIFLNGNYVVHGSCMSSENFQEHYYMLYNWETKISIFPTKCKYVKSISLLLYG